jgi:hypothetical protein
MNYSKHVFALVLATAAATPAFAQPAAPAPQAEAPAPASARAFPRDRAESEQALQSATARADVAIVAQSRQTSSVSNSSVNGTSRTGEVAIADNAFQNASGLTIVNINTGNNVAMNGSMSVNIVVNPPQ